MGVALQVSRTGWSAAELRAASVKCTDGVQVHHLLALALVLEGRPRTEAAVLNGMDRQTLSDWVHRYNTQGIEGLQSRKAPGHEPWLSAQQKAELDSGRVRGGNSLIETV